jgi:hypothetical protein
MKIELFRYDARFFYTTIITAAPQTVGPCGGTGTNKYPCLPCLERGPEAGFQQYITIFMVRE